MKTLRFLLTFLLFTRNGLGTALPQIAAQDTAPVVVAPAAASSTAANSDIAYETATLPGDRLAAWEMLGNANGLHDDHLKPWSMRGHYTTYDAYGKKKADGTIEFVWATPDRWFVSYTEGGSIWQTWKTNTGTYTLPGQTPLPYPEDRLLPALRNPLTTAWRSEQIPEHIGMQKISSHTFQCLSGEPRSSLMPDPSSTVRVCSDPGKPLLRLIEGEYILYLNQIVGFQHHLVATKINMMFGPEPVLDLQVDALQGVDTEHAAKLTPAPGAIVTLALPDQDRTPGYVTPTHFLQKMKSTYPVEAKQVRMQGKVLLACRIDTDGKTTVQDVLESPGLPLSNASKDAVNRWIFEPDPSADKSTVTERDVIVTYDIH